MKYTAAIITANTTVAKTLHRQGGTHAALFQHALVLRSSTALHLPIGGMG